MEFFPVTFSESNLYFKKSAKINPTFFKKMYHKCDYVENINIIYVTNFGNYEIILIFVRLSTFLTLPLES